MDAETHKGIIDNFRKNSKEFIAFLIKENLLKGEIRNCLSAYITEHPNRTWCQDYYWIPFMPKFVTMASTADLCNLSCRMCGGSKGPLKYVTPAQLETVLRHIPTAELMIFLAGNSEPLLNPEFVEFLGIMENYALNWQMVSNGHLLKDSFIKALVEYPYPVDFKVSLDAATPETYRNIRGANFDNVIGRLKALRDARKAAANKTFKLTINMVGMEDNFPELPLFVELAAELNASRIVLEHMHGNYSPGDYTKLPDWKAIMTEALRKGKELNIDLSFPYDSIQEITASQNKENIQPAAEKKETAGISPAASCELLNARCPHFFDIYLHIDGSLSPCPFPGKFQTDNIYCKPLYENKDYIEARIHNSKGGIFNKCHATVNCNYIMKLKNYPGQLENLKLNSINLI